MFYGEDEAGNVICGFGREGVVIPRPGEGGSELFCTIAPE